LFPSAANFLLVHAVDSQRVFSELQKLGAIVRPMASSEVSPVGIP
jgi:histidinol-phosphate/aromatic aminotransferase/cobyric acid decarboxylase-like protein